MSRGKYQSKRKPFPILSVALIVLLVGALTSGGAVAYLAMSPENNVTNTFVQASPPNPQVVNQDGKYCIDVGDPGYEVYVRAAVIPNWKYGNEIVPASPSSFSFTAGDDWILHTDGFFYYAKPISTGCTSSIYTKVDASENPGGILCVDVAAQAIQAPGETDGPDFETAVYNAWRIQPESLKPSS